MSQKRRTKTKMKIGNYKPQLVKLWWRSKYDNFFASVPQEQDKKKKIRKVVSEDFISLYEILTKISENYKEINAADYTNQLLFRFLGDAISDKYGTTASFDFCFYINNEIVHVRRNEHGMVRGQHHLIMLDFYPVKGGGSFKDKLFRITVTFEVQGKEEYVVRASNKKASMNHLKKTMPSHHRKRKPVGVKVEEIEMITIDEFLEVKL